MGSGFRGLPKKVMHESLSPSNRSSVLQGDDKTAYVSLMMEINPMVPVQGTLQSP